MAARGDTNTDTRIAIVGMSAILPSGENVRESWETIRQGLDCLADLPADRVDVTAYYHPDKTVKDKIYCTRGGFIPEYDFDAREFGLNMFQMEDSDANQTISLLKVKEALDDANIPAFSKNKKNIGCVLGIGGGQKSCHEFYSRLNYVVVEKVLAKMGMPQEDIDVAVEKYKANFPEWRLDSFPGMLGNVTAGRCSNTFNMEGMNCVVDAACASSLIAVKVAIEELLYGDADAMIAGATCTDNAVGMYMSFSKTPVFSTDQSVKAYDESTKGMLIGEGSCMMVLKRYADAVRDGDDIHAVIRACASSSDGKAAGIYTPTISGQEEALRRAYARAGVDPSTVTLVEGHGTGTPVGDKIELTALRNLFQKAYGDKKEQVAIGSIKSQIGHLKAVAGFAGLVKVVLALKHKTLPQTINVENPPNLVDGTKIQDSPLYINTMNRPWFTPPGVPRRAGISSFGFGGANYHAVLEEYEPEQEKPYRMNMLSQPVLLHAATPQQLKSTCAQQLSELEAAVSESATLKNADNIRFYKFIDQFKLSGQVPQSNARVGFLVLNIAEAIAALKSIVAQFEKAPAQKTWVLIRAGVSYRETGVAPGSVAALFSGQGSQYTHMFSDVAMNWPQFRETVASMDTAQQQVMAGSDYERVSSVLYPRNPYTSEEKQDNKKISETIYSQPTTLACSVGAFEIFKNAGFSPDFCAGHSLGEFSALYAAGCVDRESLFKLVCERAKAMRDSPKKKQGAMAAIIGPNAESIKLSGNEVWLGNCNSPSQTVITGASDSIQAESARLKAEGYRVIPLACDGAFHSPHMEAAEKSFGQVLSQTSVTSSPSPKFFSNVTGNQATGSAVKQNLSKHMTSSVQFLSQVKNMHKAGAKVFVEFGPKQVLSKLVEEILKGEDVISVAVNASSSKDSDTQLREAAVKLAVAGVPLSNFDPWELRDPKTLVASKKKRTTLRLSAATYVSKKTLDARQKIMDDGRSITYAKSATSTPVTVVDNTKVEELERKLADANALAVQAKREASALQKELEEVKSSQSSSGAVDTSGISEREMEMLQKHKALLESMMRDYQGLGEGASAAAPVPVAPVVASSSEAKQTFVSNDLLEQAETVVMQVLAAKTGYEPDMIEADMELETELGIDSIKRVEILSEVQAQLNVEAKDVDALSRTRTVGEVVDAMKAEIRGSSGPVAAAPVVAAAAPVAVAVSGSVDPALLAKAETVVMEVLAAKTGYEPDMIEEDMELETELGIDSIKRVEILSEVQAQLNVEAKDVDALSRTRTVGEVVEAMKAEIRGGSPSGPVKVSTVGFTDVRGAECEDLTICSSKSVVIGRAAKLDLDAPINRPVVIVSDGSALTDAIAVEVGARAVVLAIGNHSGVACSRKVQVADFSEAALVKALAEVESKYGVIGGFIYQHSKSTELDVQLGWAMLAAKNVSKSLKQPIQNGRTFFLGVARLDGELGLAASKKASLTDALQFAQRGAVFGLCKSIDLEWRDVFCRGVDVAANMGAADAAKSIVAEFSCPNVGIREVGYTADGTRHTTHASDLLVGTPRGQAITKEDAFIVTGGARGITPLCIREISKRVGGGTYVLLGRSKLIDEPAWAKGKEGKELEKAGLMFLKEEFKAGRGPKPTPMVHKKLVGSVAGAQEVRSSIANIEAQGGRAIYVSCDVSSVDTVKATVADLERKHSLNFTGLVHASGVLRDKLVENKKLEEFEAVYGTKVNGLVNILSALDVSNLKHMVFFSSLAGFHGNVGQSDYAMANEALNKIGFQLASNFPQLCIKSICFGPWDGGMVTPQLKKQFQSMGVQIIPREGGAETVSKIVIGSEPLQVLVGNWGVPPAKPLQKANTITITLTPEHNPFLVDHRIQGKNVLPMTVAVGYLAHLAKGLYAGHYLWAVEDAQLFKGVTIDQAVDCQVSIVEKNEEDGKIKVEAVLKSSGNGKWVPAYQAIIVLGSKPRPGMVLNSQDMNLEADPATEKSAASVYNGTTLFHGPAFQGIEHVLNYNDKRFTAKCRSVPLSGAQRGDFTTDAPQDPFVADISFQAMLVWARMLRNSGALPNNIERFDFHKEIPAGTSYYTTIEPSTSGGLPDRIWKCKFSMHDEQGEVFLSGRSSVVLNKNLKF